MQTLPYYQTLLAEYYIYFIIPFLSIAVFCALQYLTKGVNFFLDNRGKVKWKYVSFLATLQFFTSILVTWGVISAFSSEYLTSYESLKITAIIIIGSAPFSITILIWVALKLEVYNLMRARYGQDFEEDKIFTEGKNNDENSLKTTSPVKKADDVEKPLASAGNIDEKSDSESGLKTPADNKESKDLRSQ